MNNRYCQEDLQKALDDVCEDFLEYPPHCGSHMRRALRRKLDALSIIWINMRLQDEES